MSKRLNGKTASYLEMPLFVCRCPLSAGSAGRQLPVAQNSFYSWLLIGSALVHHAGVESTCSYGVMCNNAA
jgi:hypothetical protein